MNGIPFGTCADHAWQVHHREGAMEAIEEERQQQCDAQAERLALEVGCFTVRSMCVLGQVKPDTLAAWRNRGIGPPYTRIGRTPLYPIEGVRRWISERVRAREAVQ
jgi:hypothetical protein